MTRVELGGRLYCTGNYLYMIESGRALPSQKLLCRFCREFGFNFNLAKVYFLEDKVGQYREEVKESLGLNNPLV